MSVKNHLPSPTSEIIVSFNTVKLVALVSIINFSAAQAFTLISQLVYTSRSNLERMWKKDNLTEEYEIRRKGIEVDATT